MSPNTEKATLPSNKALNASALPIHPSELSASQTGQYASNRIM